MLKIGVGHERSDAVENRGRGEHPEAAWIQRRYRLDDQDYKPIDEEHRVEHHKCDRILLPGLWSGIQTFFKPCEDPRWLVFAVHDPCHIPAHWYGQNRGKNHQ